MARQVFRTNLVNLDGGYSVDEEYNIDIAVPLPGGRHLITITNAGDDWFYLDWVQLNQVLPAAYSGNWQPSPAAIGLQGTHESLLYVVAPGVSFPGNAASATLPVQHAQTLALTNWPAGNFIAGWYDPATAESLGVTQAAATRGGLALPLPDYTEDTRRRPLPSAAAYAAGFFFNQCLSIAAGLGNRRPLPHPKILQPCQLGAVHERHQHNRYNAF